MYNIENDSVSAVFENLVSYASNGTHITNGTSSKLKDIRTLEQIPHFSYDSLVKRSETIDVIWFNKREMPNSFFEIEHSTDIQNSLLKYNDLQDFYTKMFIVSDNARRNEFQKKINYSSFNDIANRVEFIDYDSVTKMYEFESSRIEKKFTDF